MAREKMMSNYHEIDEMIKSVARKTCRVYEMLEFEDLVQELWTFYLHSEKEQWMIDSGFNPAYIRTCLRNKAIDIGRSEIRKTSGLRNVDYSDPRGIVFVETNLNLASRPERPESDGYMNVRIEEIINLFEKGSDEWRLVVATGYLVGNIEQLEDEFNEMYQQLPEDKKKMLDEHPVHKKYTKKLITKVFLDKDNNSGSMRIVDRNIRQKRCLI